MIQFFLAHKYIYTCMYIYITPTPITLPRSRCTCRVKKKGQLEHVYHASSGICYTYMTTKPNHDHPLPSFIEGGGASGRGRSVAMLVPGLVALLLQVQAIGCLTIVLLTSSSTAASRLGTRTTTQAQKSEERT